MLLGRKATTNLDTVLKSKHTTLPTKLCIVKAMVFPRVMYRCESWTIKKAEHQRTDALELWCLRVPWTAKRSNQSIVKEINPEYSLEYYAETKTAILWPPNVKNRLIRENPDAGKD